MALATALLSTPRLLLRPLDATHADAVAAYLRRNAAHFARWDPPAPSNHTGLDQVRRRLDEGRAAFDTDLAYRWWLTAPPAPGNTLAPLQVLGSVHLSGISRGAFQSCALGYSLDAAAQGRGLITEALRAVIAEAFGARINLHRLQAAVRPENTRSLAVVARLAFADEGLARQYLYIDGAWRDHRLFALTNPGFTPPAHW